MLAKANDHGVVWGWRWSRARFEREDVVVQQMETLFSTVRVIFDDE